jgi:phosphatidylglycerol:prolipoprotein diacylglycerol transferase
MIDPIAFYIGPIPVHWYGLLIVSGILAAAGISTLLAKRWDEDPNLVWDALTWCVFLGLIGARLYHVVTVPPSMGVDRWYYFRNPLEILAIWKGGLGIYGAVAGGALGLYIVVRRAGRDMWRWLDITSPGLALAQAIGRWGNFVNQELYGRPTDLPWGIYIAPQNRLPGFESFERFHPIFLYESLWNLGICLLLVLLTWRYRKKLASGVIACLYFGLYSLIRFLLDFLRLDSASVGGITIAQIVALVIIVASVLGVMWRSRVGQHYLPSASLPEPD